MTAFRPAALGVANWLSLAAAPTFAVMALLAGAPPDGRVDVLCAAGGASAVGGMATMYALMGAVHLAPWLRLLSGRRAGGAPG